MASCTRGVADSPLNLSAGQVVNKAEHGSLDWMQICEKSSKVITFIDLAGHERYLKTTVFGMTGHAPHFGMLMVIIILIIHLSVAISGTSFFNLKAPFLLIS
jgi:hypothetical protein